MINYADVNRLTITNTGKLHKLLTNAALDK